MKRLALGLLAFATLVTTALGARADGGSGDASKVDPFYGAFTTSVPIAVPKFHGLEPGLQLTYSSTSGNGWLGVGWTLSGFSTIERASPGKGAPAYAASDVFLLDGQVLVPCASGSTSPSCTTGGTHSTEIENYQRIAFNSSANTWTVTSKDGTTVTYSAVYAVTPGTFRWGVTNVTDTKGNGVTYGWWCDPGADCYPSTVSYNGTVVTLYREARPDPVTFANGSYVGRTNYRIKTVDVQVSGARARSYKLTYSTSGSTSRSLLASVQQFGTDATLAAASTNTTACGTQDPNAICVTGGTALPAMTVGWPAEGTGWINGGGQAGLNGEGGTTGALAGMWADMNGDGKADYLVKTGTTTCWDISTGTGWINGGCQAGLNGEGGTTGALAGMWADMNGDGKADYLVKTGTTTCWDISTGTGWINGGCQAGLNGEGGTTGALAGTWADMNGDGKADYLVKTGTTTCWDISTGTGWINGGCQAGLNGEGGTTGALAGMWADMNGDGKVDYLVKTGTTTCWDISTGTGWINGGCQAGLNGEGGTTGALAGTWADMNGDGKVDYLVKTGTTTCWDISTGTGWINGGCQAGLNGEGGTTGALAGTWADMNGDGKVDYLVKTGTTTCWDISTGTGWINGGCQAGLNGEGGTTGALAGMWADMNGDGKVDYVVKSGTTTYWDMSAGPVLLATSISNGLGGTTTIAYTASSAWSNTYLPSGLILQTASSTTTSDGRGASSTTSYSYQGGLWSDTERRFLGFREVTAVIDAAGDYTQTYYHQGVGCISKPDTTYFKDAAGNIFSYSSYGYTENAAAPYTSLLTSRWDYECDEGPTCRRKLTQLGYDTYANSTAVYEYGDYDVAGDERTSIRGFQPNTSEYLVLLPAYENLYAGIGTAGPLVKQTLYRYDGAASYTSPPTQGLLTAKDRWESTTGAYATATFTNDAYGNRTAETDESGHATTHAYDASYHVFETQRCNALGQCTSFGWDTAIGVKTTETDASGTTSTTHDPIGRATQTVSPSGTTVTYSYVSWGDPTQAHIHRAVADGSTDGLWSDEYQDGIGRVWRTAKKGGFTRDTLYSDTSSRKWQESLWYVSGETARYDVYAYDGAGRLRTITHPDGTQVARTYASGTGYAYEAQYDEAGDEHVLWKDGLGNVVQIREKNGASYYYTTKQYDVLGNEVKVTDANSNVSAFAFDSLSRRTAVADADMGVRTYQYTPAGLLASVTDAAGLTTTLQYDAANRQTAKIHPDGSEVTWTYDEAGHGSSAGRLTSVADASHTESFSYGADGQLTSETQCVQATCETFGRSYDSVGRLAAVTYPDGEVVNSAYDAYGRLAAVSNYVTSITYDSAGSITSLVYPNGTTTTYAYDPSRRWLDSAQVTSGSATLYQSSYAYDAAARVTSISSTTNADVNLSYAYDGLNRLAGLSGAWSNTFTYDATGNIAGDAGGTYAYADPKHVHAATAYGANTYSYDANGNMLSGGGRALTWDYDNRLESSTSGTGTTSYKYNAGGQRIFKSGPNGTTLYFGQLADTVNGTLEKYYYAGPIVIAKQVAGAKTWFHADHLGSIRLMTTASGTKTNGYDYGPWGPVVSQSVTVSNELGFDGQHADAESGLVYMNARYYDPQLRRFVSADTVVPAKDNPQALNRYAFAYNNPVSNTDPSGHAPVVVAVVIAYTSASVVAYVALACIAVGYYTHDANLMTIGSVLDGCVTGGPIGGLVAAATSPVSPLSPKTKQEIGWAYAAYGLYENYEQGQAADKAKNPGNANSGNGTDQGSTGVPKTPDDPMTASVKNAEKVNAVGIQPDSPNAGVLGGQLAENAAGTSALSVDPGFHLYGILHDDLMDTITYLTGGTMTTNETLFMDVSTNVVLIGVGLREGWFGKADFMDSDLRSMEYAHNGLL